MERRHNFSPSSVVTPSWYSNAIADPLCQTSEREAYTVPYKIPEELVWRGILNNLVEMSTTYVLTFEGYRWGLIQQGNTPEPKRNE
jgi:hypothetical protein